jgi:hypothetical protein
MRQPSTRSKKTSTPVKRQRVNYNTPGRECAHADKGCCPRCIEPLAFGRQSKVSHKAVNTVVYA